MAYIVPDSQIILLRNCPLDNTYQHTIYFSSKSDQSSYFLGLAKYNFKDCTYQRLVRNKCRVQVNADDIYDCNYLMYRNTAYGNKWFYAFIQSVEYVNDITSEITFEIDVMQTWFFDYKLGMSFVEREHTSTDELFEHIKQENLYTEELRINKYTYQSVGKMNVCALTSKNSDGSAATGRTINGVYTPLNVIAGIPADDPESVNAVLNEFVSAGQEDAIVALYQYPAWMGDASTKEPVIRDETINVNLTDLHGYVPRNKKLFAYPFNYLVVSNNEGQTAELKLENWSSGHIGEFRQVGVFITTPCILMYPRNYRGAINDYDSGLTISNFPICAFAGDVYKAYIAQNKSSIGFSIFSSVISGIGSTLSGGVTGAIVGSAGGPITSAGGALMGAASGGANILSTVGSLYAKAEDIKNIPPQVHGQAQCDSLNVGIQRIGYTWMQMSIRASIAQQIDWYFDMFGYTIKRVKVPNRNVRPHWTYTKTIGCVVTGSVPADDMNKICQIYDNGITFWKKGSEVGDYSLDNRV